MNTDNRYHWQHKDLLDVTQLSGEDVRHLLDLAASFQEINRRPVKKVPTLKGKTVVLFFVENSTRTKTSFDVAGKRLSADTYSLAKSGSSLNKGESLKDTALTLQAMGPDDIVIRHSSSGAAAFMADLLPCGIVNGGDGWHAHPTQALLDLYTIRKRFGHIDGLRVGIVGDSVHSRVVGSLAPALVKMGAEVTLVGPGPFLPARPDVLGAKSTRDFDALLPDLDVVYMLRVQQERMEGASIPSTRDYSLLFGLDERRAKLMAPQAVVMHPGPINRGVEMCSQVADAANSLITSQVNAGVSVRMAVIYLLLGGEGNVVA